MKFILTAHVYVCAYFLNSGVAASFTCAWLFLGLLVLHSCFSTVWPSLVLPAVLTLVHVDSKHSCRSQRPRSGRTWGSEGQWWRGERAFREHDDRKGKV